MADLARENRRILVIDDNPSIHQDFRKILVLGPDEESAMLAAERAIFDDPQVVTERPSFEVDSAIQGQAGFELVKHALNAGSPYALAFVDMRMPPGWDGLETIERIWAVDANIQVVICSAHADYDWSELVARLGHADKLLIIKKPFEPIEVVQCASAMICKWNNERKLHRHIEQLEVAVHTRTQRLEAANRQLRHLATHDALTGLPNRVLLEDRLAQSMAHSQRDGHQFAVLMIDLDRFKLVNDSLGHRAGDELLREAARRLADQVRSVDTVARIGGDEFAMLIDSVSMRSEAEDVARRVVDSLTPAVKIGGVEVHISASIGIAFYPGDASGVDALLAKADAAMYCAKQRGRNNAQVFAAGMDTVTQDKMHMERELYEALATGQFELLYQPKVDMETGMVHSAEALIRWRHPQRGLVMPSTFIPLAEECGLIGEIGRWVIEEACRQAKAWQDSGLPAVRVAVNLSAAQFRHKQLLHVIGKALSDAALDPRYLEVELTETAVMTDPEESVAILEQLSRMGVIVSVDDFGTGYSSMSYLRRFPIDKLKIDRSFINEIANRPDDAAIVSAIVSLAHSLRLKVVAEGVETPAQLEFLRSLGCDQYQGYHFSAPIQAADFALLMRGQNPNWLQLGRPDFERTHSKLAAYRRG